MRTAMRAMLALAVVALGGCAPDGANEGDCNAKVRFQGSIYRVHSDMRDHAPLGRSVGQGEVVGCGGLEAPAIDEVEVRRIKGVSPAVALATSDQDWGGLFIREDLASEPSSWPEELVP